MAVPALTVIVGEDVIVTAPEPLLNVVPANETFPPKLVAGLCPVKSQTPPEFTVTFPVNVLVPVAPVPVFNVPVTSVVVPTLNAKFPIVTVQPLAIVKLPVIARAAPVVNVFADPFKATFPPTEVTTKPDVVAVPDMVKLPLIVVVAPIVLALVPERSK